jgi:hypothetical protein
MRPMPALLCGGNGAVRFPEADGHDGPERVGCRPMGGWWSEAT